MKCQLVAGEVIELVSDPPPYKMAVVGLYVVLALVAVSWAEIRIRNRVCCRVQLKKATRDDTCERRRK